MITTKLVTALFVAAVLFPSAAFSQQTPTDGRRAAPVATGDTAPDFTLEDQDGRKLTLSAERGKRPVVLVFYRGYW